MSYSRVSRQKQTHKEESGMTDCNEPVFEFQAHNGKKVVMDFEGGDITSDAGAMFLKETDQRINLLQRFSDCFEDHRDPDLIEHSVDHLSRQRVFGLCLGLATCQALR